MSSFELHAVGIGAQTAGSTWVSDMARQHPDVAVWHPKELEFFNDRKSYYQATRKKAYQSDLAGLAKYFNDPENELYHLEVTPNYFWDRAAAERIAALFPNIKIVANLRQPVERAFSQWVMARYNHRRETRSFEEVMQHETEYTERSRYAQQLDLWLAHFPRKQIHLIALDEILSDPASTAYRLFEFLGLRPDVPLNASGKSNRAKSTRIPALQNGINALVRQLSAVGLTSVVERARGSKLRNWVLQKNQHTSELPKFDSAYNAQYWDRFAADVDRLENEWGLQLNAWKP